jgi:pimeloyl-ACP methyl ester carboxylesterase
MREELTIPAGRATLAAETDGEGPVVVCLHAGVCDRRMWRPLADALHTTCRVVAYDRRGFGETPAVDEPRSQVDDLVAVLDHVAAGSPSILVGCSQGGRIAIDATLAPSVAAGRIRGLVLVAPAVSGAPSPVTLPPPIQTLSDAIDAADNAGDIDRVNALEAHAWLDGPLAPEGRVGGELRRLFLSMNAIALGAAPMPSLIEPAPSYERLREIAVPTLVICGDLDFPHLQARCRQIADRVPRAEGHVVPDTAHLPTLERPEPCATLIRTWIAKLAGADGSAPT